MALRQILVLVDVHGKSRELAGFQRVQHGLRVHQPAARGVDQDRAGLHHRKCGCVDQVAVFGRHGAMEQQRVGLTQQRVAVDVLRDGADAVLFAGVAGQQAAAKAAEDAQRGLADAARAQHAHGQRADLAPAQAQYEVVLPVDAVQLLAELAQRAQQQYGVLGDGAGRISGYVCRADAVFCQRRHVQMVAARGARQQVLHALLVQIRRHFFIDDAACVDGDGLIALRHLAAVPGKRAGGVGDVKAVLLVHALADADLVRALRSHQQLHTSVPPATSFLTQSAMSCVKSRGEPPVWNSTTVASSGK